MPATMKSTTNPTFAGTKRHRGRALLVLLALIIALPFAALPGPVAGQETSGCGCAVTGDYKNPAGIVTAGIKEDGSSPKGTYQVSVSGTHPAISLTVKRKADNSTVLTLNTSAVNWGFSPDEDRFLTISHHDGATAWQLYDLSAADPSARLLLPEPSRFTSSGRLGFSPNGDYLMFVSLVNATMANIEYWNISTGERHDLGNFSFIQGAPSQGKGGETYNGVTFGFSPFDRAFVYAYVSSANQVQLNVLNLATGARVEDTPFLTGFWQFSPCGDVFAMAQQMSQVSLDVRLISTDDGSLLNPGSTGFSLGAAEFKATETTHTMTLTTESGATTHDLAPNTAGEGCGTPTGDTAAPTWPDDAGITASNVTETTVGLAWSAAQDNTAVTGYRVSVYRDDGSSGSLTGCQTCLQMGTGSGSGSSSGGYALWIPGIPVPGGSPEDSLTLVGTLETDGRSATIANLAPGTAYTFKVEAFDAAANESTGGPSVTVTTTAIPVGEISGRVWFDTNGNGQRDFGETHLIFPDLIAWRIVDSDFPGQYTDGGFPRSQSLSDGRYFFRDLEPGTYLIAMRGTRLQSSPAGFAPHIVTLGPNQGVRGVDFQVTSQEVSQTGDASIQGIVWEDLNADGARNGSEPGLAGATVCAYHSNVGWIDCMDSETDGSYHFGDLPPGLYQVWADPSTVGNRFSTLPPDDLSHIFTLASGSAATQNLGYAPGTGAIEGIVWDDANNNGVRDSGEAGLGDVEVCQWGPVTSDCTMTAADGSYAFTGLVPGEYEVEIETPDGHEQTYPADGDYWSFELEPGEVRDDIDFGVYTPPPAEIHGVVWLDLDLNGQRDEGEPGVADIEVCYDPGFVLLGSFSEGGSSECVFTNEAGGYSFVDVPPDAYYVRVSEPTTYPEDEHYVELEPGEVRTADFGLEPADQPPVVEPIPDQNHREGDEVSLQVNATDPEDGTLMYDASGLPAGLTLDEDSGIITGTLESGSATGSPYAVTIYVADELWNESEIMFTWTVDPSSNTPAGSDVTVSPLDDDGMTIVFSSVTAAGETSVITSDTGPEAPAGFLLGDPPIYYDISTTATFTGSATVCIEYDETTYGNGSALALFHYEDGAWVNVTTSHDPVSNTVCGDVESFSPFVVLERDTTPPTLHLPDDLQVEGNTVGGANVDLPDVTATDMVDPDPVVSCDAIDGFFAFGDTVVTCTAEDDAGNQANGSYTVSVVDTTPPSVVAGAVVTVVADGPSGTGATHPDIAALLDSAEASDIVDGALDVEHDAPEMFPLGETVVTFTATDGSGNVGQTTRTVTVINHPPDCFSATPSIATLWPANHKMHEVTIEGVTDPDGHPVSIVITAIYQDELVLGTGSGKHAPDGQGVGTAVAGLRAERDARGDGRVYHVVFEASDGIDTCTGEVTVSVPKKAKAQAVDGGPLHNSTTVQEEKAKRPGRQRG